MPISGGASFDPTTVLANIAALNAQNIVITANVTGLAGAAMRGTDGVDTSAMVGTNNALLAASYLGLTLTPYAYGPTQIANLATYVPAAKTIVLQAEFSLDIAAVDKIVFVGSTNADKLVEPFAVNNGLTCSGWSAVMYCDGTSGFYNSEGGPRDLELWGVTLT